MTDRTSEKAFNNATGKTATEDAKRRAMRMMKEKQFFEEKAGEHRGNLHSKQTHEALDLDRRHEQAKSLHDEKLHAAYGEQKDQTKDELQQLKAKADKSRLTQDERDRAKALQLNLADIQKREKEQRDGLLKQQATQKQELADKHKAQGESAERSIGLARQQRQAAGWTPAPVMFNEVAAQDAEPSFQKPAQSAEGSQGAESPPEPFQALHAPLSRLRGQGRATLSQQDRRRVQREQARGLVSGSKGQLRDRAKNQATITRSKDKISPRVIVELDPSSRKSNADASKNIAGAKISPRPALKIITCQNSTK